MNASFSIITISTILIAYLSIFVGHIIGKWSNDELKYKNYFFAYLWLYILVSCICFALNYYLAPAIIFICYLLLRTSYIWNLMYFIVGLALVLTPYFEFAVAIATLFGLSFGAIIRTKIAYPEKNEKKSKHIFKRTIIMSFLNSLGIFFGIGIGIAIRLIFK